MFIYKGTTALVECKVVKSVITPSSKDWEDFELKLRKRDRQNVVGLFCSLYPVSPTTIENTVFRSIAALILFNKPIS